MNALNPIRLMLMGACLLCLTFAGQISLHAESPPPKGQAATAEKSESKEGDKSADEKAESEELPEDPGANPNSIIGTDANLPLISEMPIPESGALLQGLPFDWVVLVTEKVVVVDPVLPRPQTLEKLEAEFQRLSKIPLPKREEDPIGREELLTKRRAARFLNITLQEGDELEFSIDRALINEVLHFEDVILRRVDILLEELKPGEAYELLELVYDRDRNWPGIEQRERALLFSEAGLREKNGELEDSLGFLERLHSQDPVYPKLEEAVVRVTGALHQSAVESHDFRLARFFLNRVRKLYPSAAAVQDRTSQLMGLAQAELDQALESERKSDFSAAIEFAEKATRIWPTLPNLRGSFDRMHTRFQRIRVGVIGFAHTTTSDRLFDSVHDRRNRNLTQVPLFNVERQDGVTLRYRSRVLDEWEPTALGRSIIFHPRFRRLSWESLPAFSSSRLVEQILIRIDPASPIYDERLDNLIDQVEFRSPQEFEVQFAEVPLNAAGLLTFDALPAGQLNTDIASLPQNGHRFTLVKEDETEQVYERIRPESFELQVRHVARITETLYPSRDRAVQGMIRGEIDLLDDIQPWDVALLAKQANVFVLPYVIPSNHVIQFHPRSKYARNRTLRRSLSLALDRSGILNQEILHNTATAQGVLTTAPFRNTHPGYNQTLDIPIEDARLAISLALAARKELGEDLPPLKLALADSPNPPEVINKLIANWKRVGIEVEVVPSDLLTQASLGADNPPWDMVYRIVRMTDPQVELWPFLTLQKHPTVSALASLPAWLRQKLLLLDQSGNYDTANERLRELHQLLWAEAELIPLWEVKEHLAARKHLRGLVDPPMYFYQNVEQWRSLPWFPMEVE